MDERLNKLRELQQKREEAQDLNLESTKEEQFKKDLQIKEEGKLDKKKIKYLKLKEKMEAKEQGIDYERVQGLKYSIDEVENWNKIQKEKLKRADAGFSDYNTLAYRKYKKLINKIKPDLKDYNSNKLKKTSEEQIFTEANSLDFLNYKPSKDKVEKMATDLNEQIEKRENFSRRRTFNDDEDITYINERNYRFNKKIARAFDPYTEDLKKSIERGTAL